MSFLNWGKDVVPAHSVPGSRDSRESESRALRWTACQGGTARFLGALAFDLLGGPLVPHVGRFCQWRQRRPRKAPSRLREWAWGRHGSVLSSCHHNWRPQI